MSPSHSSSGMTLIELLMVIVVIVVLGVIIMIAIDPKQKNIDAHNAQRRGDVVVILNAVYEYALAHGNAMPEGIPTDTPKEICVTKAASCNGGVNLDSVLNQYLLALPKDPLATGTGTLYTIKKEANGQVTVAAPKAENASITFTR